MTGSNEIKCGRCGCRYRPAATGASRWNVTLSRGVVAGATCPTCQTAEENVEAEINLATLDYRTDRLGRVQGRPKAASEP